MADQTPTPEPTTQNTEILRSRSHMMTRSRYFIAAAGVVATTLVIPPGASALSPSTKTGKPGSVRLHRDPNTNQRPPVICDRTASASGPVDTMATPGFEVFRAQGFGRKVQRIRARSVLYQFTGSNVWPAYQVGHWRNISLKPGNSGIFSGEKFRVVTGGSYTAGIQAEWRVAGKVVGSRISRFDSFEYTIAPASLLAIVPIVQAPVQEPGNPGWCQYPQP